MNNEIYFISKDINLSNLIRDALEPLGYVVITTGELGISSLFLEETHWSALLIIDLSIFSSELPEDLIYNESTIVISDNSKKAMALEAMRRGAYGYLGKPLNTEELIIIVNKMAGLTEEDEIIAAGRGEMKRLFKETEKFSKESLPILIAGEDGIDLGRYARALHRKGQRKRRFFLSLNPKLKGQKIHSLIGYLKNSSPNLEGCSIFLEDLYDFDVEMVKELSIIAREKNIWLIGGLRQKAYTFHDERGEDFLLLFGKREVTIPPLRERKEEIPLIAEHLLRRMEKRFRLGKKRFSPSAKSYLVKYQWPGNDREMEDTIMKAYISSEGEIIDKRHLFRGNISICPLEEFLSLRLKGLFKENSNLYYAVINEVEKALISIVLRDVKGNQVRASRILGINRNTLRSKIKEYGLDRLSLSNLTK